jgi:hypothetical protein
MKVLKENSSPVGAENVLPSAESVARPLRRLMEDVPRLLEVWTPKGCSDNISIPKPKHGAVSCVQQQQ